MATSVAITVEPVLKKIEPLSGAKGLLGGD
jgi:hypothetical protein